MKRIIVLLLVFSMTVAASERSSLEFSLGGGVWMPALFDSDSELSPGPCFNASLQIPPSLGNCFMISVGYVSAGTDRPGFGGIAGIPLTVGYRLYPFFRRYAGPRGIEPLIGVYGGGMLLWDDPEGGGEKTNTGAGVIGAELGARIHISQTVSLDISVSPEWVPAGSALAGESGEDISGLNIKASVIF